MPASVVVRKVRARRDGVLLLRLVAIPARRVGRCRPGGRVVGEMFGQCLGASCRRGPPAALSGFVRPPLALLSSCEAAVPRRVSCAAREFFGVSVRRSSAREKRGITRRSVSRRHRCSRSDGAVRARSRARGPRLAVPVARVRLVPGGVRDRGSVQAVGTNGSAEGGAGDNRRARSLPPAPSRGRLALRRSLTPLCCISPLQLGRASTRPATCACRRREIGASWALCVATWTSNPSLPAPGAGRRVRGDIEVGRAPLPVWPMVVVGTVPASTRGAAGPPESRRPAGVVRLASVLNEFLPEDSRLGAPRWRRAPTVRFRPLRSSLARDTRRHRVLDAGPSSVLPLGLTDAARRGSVIVGAGTDFDVWCLGLSLFVTASFSGRRGLVRRSLGLRCVRSACISAPHGGDCR